MSKFVLPLCAALLLLPAAASASPATTSVNDEGARVETEGEVQQIIFDKDDNVDGEVLSADGFNVPGRTAQVHASMISIRGVFTPELIRLANDI